MELILNTEEQELLLSIIEQRHRELLKEIAHTDHREFKHALRKNEKVLESVLSRLRGPVVQDLRA
ncbi:MAG: hypothetical protein WCA16_08070 [Candidatus Sulfotelmatobacter sp.]